MSMSEMFTRNTNAPAGMSSQESAYVAAGKAQGVSSQVPGSGAAKAGNDAATYGFYSPKDDEYYAIKFRSQWEARAFAAVNGWEFDCVIPEGWK